MISELLQVDQRSPARGCATIVTALGELTGAAPVLVTGENTRAAGRLAAGVGMTDGRSGPLPQDKVTAVQGME
ncbi:hypothetical protein [Streptomyces sp. NPDC058424]|uniref:hypothetical protein n=1 Tax=Streptomyces sp. NPDC058424 TaxID=3346491 RepID=UPI003652F1AF